MITRKIGSANLEMMLALVAYVFLPGQQKGAKRIWKLSGVRLDRWHQREVFSKEENGFVSKSIRKVNWDERLRRRKCGERVVAIARDDNSEVE